MKLKLLTLALGFIFAGLAPLSAETSTLIKAQAGTVTLEPAEVTASNLYFKSRRMDINSYNIERKPLFFSGGTFLLASNSADNAAKTVSKSLTLDQNSHIESGMTHADVFQASLSDSTAYTQSI